MAVAARGEAKEDGLATMQRRTELFEEFASRQDITVDELAGNAELVATLKQFKAKGRVTAAASSGGDVEASSGRGAASVTKAEAKAVAKAVAKAASSDSAVKTEPFTLTIGRRGLEAVTLEDTKDTATIEEVKARIRAVAVIPLVHQRLM